MVADVIVVPFLVVALIIAIVNAVPAAVLVKVGNSSSSTVVVRPSVFGHVFVMWQTLIGWSTSWRRR